MDAGLQSSRSAQASLLNGAAAIAIPASPTSPWLTPAQAAAYLSVKLGTIRNWTSAHYIPFSRRGHVVRYHRVALDAWLMRRANPGRATFTPTGRAGSPSQARNATAPMTGPDSEEVSRSC
jgi:excisionase family DNA binding protein